jgi:hypothetical protein
MGMNLVFVFFLLISQIEYGYAAPTSTTSLQPGECMSEPDNKVYMSSIQASSIERYKSLRQEIGEDRIKNLKNTETQHFYFCRIQCLDSKSQANFLWVQMSDSPSRAMDMQGFQCPMVSIENVHIVGSIWGPQPVVRKFEALTSHFFEVHQWLIRSEFQLSSSQTESRLKPTLSIFQQVGIAFINSNSEIMNAAGAQLLEISALTKSGRSLLIKHTDQLNEMNWALSQDFSSPEFFVLNMLKTHARFLQYSDLSFLKTEANDVN